MIAAATTGFLTAFSLILAIGAQNAFVLRQGLLGRHVFWLCLLCAVSDALLISAGVLGFGTLVTFYPGFPIVMQLAGALFLIAYGALRFRAAVRGQEHLEPGASAAGLWRTLAIGAAFTWLNPHVYLDTLGLIGAVSTKYPTGPVKLSFALGAITSSFVFFFSLGFGARLLAPWMQSSRAWQILDIGIGLTMWALAAGLLWTAF